MRIGDVSRPRRFANPARLRWYAFHRSVRFALRMMKADEAPSYSELVHFALPADIQGRTPSVFFAEVGEFCSENVDGSNRQELDSD
jgi:hypothetical protein